MTTDSDRAVESVGARRDQHLAGEKVALLVLGMHRSGTSALTRVLNLLGCSLPQQVMGGNPTNPVGHWEPQAIVDLNDEILEAAGSAWNDWQKLNPGWEKSHARAGFVHKAAQTLQAEYEGSSFFVLKDPRICRIVPFWRDVLQQNGIEPRVVIPIRNPLEVAASLHARDGIDLSIGYLIWLRYILDAERSTRGAQRVFTTYSGLLEDWTKVIERIADRLAISWPRYSARVTLEIESFLDKSLRHHAHTNLGALNGSAVPAWVRQTYDIVQGWSEGAESPGDFVALDAISKDLDAAAAAFATPMALFQQATVRLRDAAGHIAAADGERDTAIGRADAAKRALVEQREEVGRLASRLAEQEGQFETFRSERDAALLRADSAERSLIEQGGEVERVASLLQDRERELEASRASCDAAMSRADAGERALRERSAERDAVAARLVAAEARQTELQVALDVAQEAKLSLERDLIDYRREQEAVTAKLAETGSELLQRKEELRQIWAELCTEKARAEALEAECKNHAQEQARQQRLLERERERGSERLRTLEAAQQELAHVRAELVEAKKSLEQARQDSADSQSKLAVIETEMEKTHAAARAAVSQRSQTFNEIAIVTQLLRDSEQEVQTRDETVHWLSQVYAIMLRRPRWWVFLSRKAQFKRLSRRVEMRGMFDSESYLAKNPDVAATGADPLRHYITHGIKESRRR